MQPLPILLQEVAGYIFKSVQLRRKLKPFILRINISFTYTPFPGKIFKIKNWLRTFRRKSW
jgi:hypothetical protein